MRNFTKRIVIAALVALTSAVSLESSQVRLAEVQAYQGEVVPVPKAA